MDFFSPLFFGFFLIVLFLYYLVNDKFQKTLILLASSVFIASLSVSFLIHTYLFILVTYISGFLIVKFQQRPNIKKLIYNTSLFIIIGGLVFFKYINFLLSSVFQFLEVFELNVSYSALKIIAPIGISYYTFQGIGYIIQIYRGNETMEKNIVVFSNYFLFFPKFLAGPIEQSKNFIPQLLKKYSFENDNIIEGFKLILWGAFKKLVIADRLSLIINGVYPNMGDMSGNIFLFTFLLQPLHLYCDFSGYTDIALGIGRTFGFKLTDNFKRPFFSSSVTMFWQRYHISLSSWCNEFIFKRLTFKNRKWGIWSPVYSVFITFLILGIWHGASWNFVILGVLQGIAINYEFFTKRYRLQIFGKLPKKLVLYSSFVLVYLFYCLTLVFFNAEKVSDSLYFISHIFSNIDITDLSIMFLSNFDKAIVLFSLIFVFIVEFRQEQGKDLFIDMTVWPRWTRWSFYYVIFILILYFGSPNQEFVYMQF